MNELVRDFPALTSRTGRAVSHRTRFGPRRLLALLAVVAAFSTAGCAGQVDPGGTSAPASLAADPETPGPGGSGENGSAPSIHEVSLAEPLDHVHGLLVTREDALVAGTHTGVVAIAADGAVSRVGDSRDDLMGMTGVPGTGVLASSGHPGVGSSLPNPVGLIRSDDSGLTWTSVALTGEVDFHALATDGAVVVGYGGGPGVLVSTDAGSTFTPGAAIAPAALAIASGHVWATTADGVQHSTDNGRTFTVVDGAPFLLLVASGPDGSLWGVDTDGIAWRSTDGTSWERRGAVGPVEALAVADHATAYAATATTLFILG